MLEVTKPAMDYFMMIAGSRVSEILPFYKRNSQSSQCRISGNADSVDPATHNQNIVLFSAQRP